MKRKRIVPEVIQSSGMDCGPAAVKSMLAGFGIQANYGRLREACQTDVDGTSIDTLEEVMMQLGLDAEQQMIPTDHLFSSSESLPVLAVVLHPGGALHFMVAWSVHGGFVQVMDPAKGRRWMSKREFLQQLFVHEMEVEAEDWAEWARSPEFLHALGFGMSEVGFSKDTARARIDEALDDSAWMGIATLDAAVRMTRALIDAKALRLGSHAVQFAETLFRRALTEEGTVIPDRYWSVRPSDRPSDEGEMVEIRGAVLVRANGLRTKEQSLEVEPLSPDLTLALQEPPLRPMRELWRTIRQDGLFPPSLFLSALVLAAAMVVVEALLFRGLFDMGRELAASDQRLAGGAVLLLFLCGLLVLEHQTFDGLLRMGRRLEVRLRLAFREKIAILDDRYFSSRLTSDMAQRAHSVHRLQKLPLSAGLVVRDFFHIVFTTIGLVWLSPDTALIAIAAAIAAIAVPAFAAPMLLERDLRARSHVGALSRFYLDALLGLLAIRSHGAERAIRSEHASLLDEWVSASLRYQRTAVVLEGVQLAIGTGLVVWLLLVHVQNVGSSGALLMVYWALQLPARGNSLIVEFLRIPGIRNVALRLRELLGASEEVVSSEPSRSKPSSQAPVEVSIENASVMAGGHVLLDNISLHVPAGQHVAIVGTSGAGKSSLMGLLLGVHRASSGKVLVDGQPLQGHILASLREATAWVDPSVQLWNRSLLDNLLYGGSSNKQQGVATVLDAAELRSLLEGLPHGLQESLGEGGGLLSGGEGQRVRLGRALLRSNVSLVILDEPFRGLDRAARKRLLARARAFFRNATLFCVTHDVGDALDFDRAVVMADGGITEQGTPGDLASDSASSFSRILEAERVNSSQLWAADNWRHIRLEQGILVEVHRE